MQANENWNSAPVLQQYLSFSTHIFANFTIGMIENKTEHLLKYEELHRKFNNKAEILHMLKRNIAAFLLKILCKNLNSVKHYDKTNMWGICLFVLLL